MALHEMLQALAWDSQPIAWDAWWVFALAAEKQPDVWAGAWTSVGEETQQRVLDRIARDASPIADFLVVLLSEKLQPDAMGAARRMMKEDSADATNRQIDRLRILRDRFAGANSQGAVTTDLVIEVEQLRERKSQLEAALEADPKHAERVALEQEITRLRALKASVQTYDHGGREALRRSLQEETDALSVERRRIEEGIRTARETKTAIESTLREGQAALAEALAELTCARVEAARLTTENNVACAIVSDVFAIAGTARAGIADTARRLAAVTTQAEEVATQISSELGTAFAKPESRR
jgi:chromosome segregation ATPase